MIGRFMAAPRTRCIIRRKQITDAIRQGKGRMPGFPSLEEDQLSAVIEYLTTGENKELPATELAPPPMRYRFTSYHKFLDPEGYPAIVPPWGTLNAINLNTGEYAWKILLESILSLQPQG
jgi:quinoprotein glucose dehydrogenase